MGAPRPPIDHQACRVLIADDSENDRLLIRRALKRTCSRCHLVGEVENGERAIAYLAGTGEFQDRVRFPLPTILLLDLKMPRLNGFGVLRWMREQPIHEVK